MQQREYCSVQESSVFSTRVTFFTEDGDRTEKFENLNDTIAKLGLDGWELVEPWYFKRPL